MDLKPIYMTYSLSPQKIQQKIRSIPISKDESYRNWMIGNPIFGRHISCQVLSLEDALCLMELEEDVPMQLGVSCGWF